MHGDPRDELEGIAARRRLSALVRSQLDEVARRADATRLRKSTGNELAYRRAIQGPEWVVRQRVDDETNYRA